MLSLLCAGSHGHQKLLEILEAASRLRKHNEHLFKLINRTETKLLEIAKWAAGRAQAPTAITACPTLADS